MSDPAFSASGCGAEAYQHNDQDMSVTNKIS